MSAATDLRAVWTLATLGATGPGEPDEVRDRVEEGAAAALAAVHARTGLLTAMTSLADRIDEVMRLTAAHQAMRTEQDAGDEPTTYVPLAVLIAGPADEEWEEWVPTVHSALVGMDVSGLTVDGMTLPVGGDRFAALADEPDRTWHTAGDWPEPPGATRSGRTVT